MTLSNQWNIRLTDEEYERVERVIERIKERERPEMTVNKRVMFLRALEQLESYLDRLDREKGRKR